MPRRHGGNLTLRLQYWHQSHVGPSQDHHALLVKLLKQYLGHLVQSRSAITYLKDLTRSENLAHHPWECKAVPLKPGPSRPRSLVSVQVKFAHRYHSFNAATASSQFRHLWDKIQALTRIEGFRNLFGNPMLCLNIFPIDVPRNWRSTYTYGILVQNLAIETKPTVHIEENPLKFLGESVVIAASIVKTIALYAAQAKAGLLVQEKSLQKQLGDVVQICSDLTGQIQGVWDSGQAPKTEADAALQRIAEDTVMARRYFEEAFLATSSRMDVLCNRRNPSGEQVMEAIVALQKMTLLCGATNEGSRCLVSRLKADQKDTNKVIATASIVGGVLGLIAAGFFFGPVVLTGSLIYSWVAAGTVTTALGAAGVAGSATAGVGALTLGVKMPLQDSRFEKVLQTRQSLDQSLAKLRFLVATTWVEKVWRMKLDEIPQSAKDDVLSSLGVDPEYFGAKEYNMAQLRSAWREFERRRQETDDAFAGLYRDLGITTENVRQVATP